MEELIEPMKALSGNAYLAYLTFATLSAVYICAGMALYKQWKGDKNKLNSRTKLSELEQ